MLHDEFRNNIYEEAIRIMISSFIAEHKRAPVVLDIGTGTGLLAMMCARHGADFVFAVEQFEALAKVASNVIARNNMDDKVTKVYY